jgi:hypothetical protein
MLKTYVHSDCGVLDSDIILSCGHINIANDYAASIFRVKAEPDVARLYGKCDMNQQRKDVVAHRNFGRQREDRVLSGPVAMGNRKV